MWWRPHTDETRPAAIKRLRWLARFLDNAVTIPGTRVSFGCDALIGLVPVLGDVVTTGAALFIVSEAKRLGASNRTLGTMLGNVAIDFLLGEVPILGDVGDAFFKANARNLRLLEAEFARQEAAPDVVGPAPETPPRRRVENIAA